jgi:hypothetical protein
VDSYCAAQLGTGAVMVAGAENPPEAKPGIKLDTAAVVTLWLE